MSPEEREKLARFLKHLPLMKKVAIAAAWIFAAFMIVPFLIATFKIFTSH